MDGKVLYPNEAEDIEFSEHSCREKKKHWWRSTILADQRHFELSSTLNAHQSTCENPQRTQEEKSDLNTKMMKHRKELQGEEAKKKKSLKQQLEWPHPRS